MERAEDLRELYQVLAGRSPPPRHGSPCCRRTDEQLAEIEAHQRRIESAAAEPLARQNAELDFHGVVVDAAHNSMLAHVGAMCGSLPVAAACRGSTAPDDESVGLRVAVIEAIRSRDEDAAEKAMRMLVDLAWESIAKSGQEDPS